MKKTLLTILFFALVQEGYGQWKREWSVGYAQAAPMGRMEQTVDNAHGIALDFYLLAPSKRYAVGVDLSYSIYGFSESRQQYSFSDGTTADMDINVSNSILNGRLSARYNLVKDKALTPYVGTKGGYSGFQTNLNIYDPDDTDNCEPVETDLLLADGTWTYSIGGGLSYDLSAVFKKMRSEFLFINFSMYYTQGGDIDYMNSNKSHTNHSNMPSRSQDLEATFINTQTQVTHKHHVGNVYTNALQMMDFRLSVAFRSR